MKRFLKMKYLPLAVLGSGVITYLLRTLLWADAIVGNGLLPVGTFPDIVSWIMVAITVCGLFLATRLLRGTRKYQQNFAPSMYAGIAMVLTAASFCVTSLVEFAAGTDTVNTASSVLGILATFALIALAYGRYKGLRPNMLLHSILCVYLMLYLVSHYRLWSSSPQLQSYAFELLAIVFVMLACYQRAAFDAGKGNRQAYTFFTLLALYFCIATLPGCDNPVFFLGAAVWMYFTPCNLTLPVAKEN